MKSGINIKRGDFPPPPSLWGVVEGEPAADLFAGRPGACVCVAVCSASVYSCYDLVTLTQLRYV